MVVALHGCQDKFEVQTSEVATLSCINPETQQEQVVVGSSCPQGWAGIDQLTSPNLSIDNQAILTDLDGDQPLIDDFTGMEFFDFTFAVVGPEEQCALVADYLAEKPSTGDLRERDSGTFKVCTRRQNSDGSFAYAESALFAFDKDAPQEVSDVVLTEDEDGYIISFAASGSADTAGYRAKVCSSNDCSTDCTDGVEGDASGLRLTAELESNLSYYGCVQTLDAAGLASDWQVSAVPYIGDSSAPQGGISLQGGADYTTSTAPTINLSYDSDATEYQLCNSPQPLGIACAGAGLLRAWTAVSAAAASYSFSGSGSQSLYVQYRDAAGNVSPTYEDAIVIDNTSPTAASGVNWPSVWSSSTATVTFTAGSDADSPISYNAKACTDAACSLNCVGDTLVTASSATLTGLVEGVTYYACIQSQDSVGLTSSWVASGSSTVVDATAPTDPSGVTASAFNSGPISVSFTPGVEVNPDDFQLKACTSNDCSSGCVGDTTSAASPGSITSGLVSEVDYYLCVRGADLAGNLSNWVASGSSSQYDVTVPSGTITLANVGGYATTHTPAITLSADADVSDYKLCNTAKTAGNECSGGEELLGFTAYSASPSAYDFGADGSHTLYVQFRDDAGQISATASGSITVDETNPAAPSALNWPSSHGSSATPLLSYTAGSDAVSFASHEVMTCTDSSCSAGCSASVDEAGNSLAVGTLVEGTGYYGCVRSRDSAGNLSAWVNTVASYTYDATSPLAPTTPAWSTAITALTSDSVTYGNGSDAISFSSHNVKACTDSSCSLGCVGVASDSASPVTISGLSNGGVYYACIQSEDSAGNTSVWVASAATLTVDNGNPTDPSGITWDSTIGTATSEGITFTDSVDGTFNTHNIKACTDSGCSLGCVGVSTDSGSPASLSGLSDGVTYYACVQGEDAGANTSNWVASSNTYTVDQTNPAVASGISWDGVVGQATTQGFSFTDGSDANFTTHNIQACTDSGCTTACVGATTDTSGAAANLASLVVGSVYYACVQTVDGAGNTSAWVASSNTYSVDQTAPNPPTTVAWSAAYLSLSSDSITYTDGSDAVSFAQHRVKACTDTGCSSGCVGETTDAGSPSTVGSLVDTGVYYACVRAEDSAGNTSAWVASAASTTVDLSNPSDPVGVSWDSTIGNVTSEGISYTASSDTNFSTHNIQACTNSGCSTACVGATTEGGNTASLTTLVAGSTYYACVQGLDLAGRTSNWVASSNTYTVDQVLPVAPSALSFTATYTAALAFTFSYTDGSDAVSLATHQVKACTVNTCASGCVDEHNDADGSTSELDNLVEGTAYYGCVRSQDAAGNNSAWVATATTITYDNTDPSAPSGVNWAGAYTSTTSASISFTDGSDAIAFNTHNLQACTDSGCSVGCVGSLDDSASPATLGSLVSGTSYYACVRSQDGAGNTSAWVASAATILVDTVDPLPPSAVAFDSSFLTAEPVNVNFTVGSDAISFDTHNVQLCTNAACSTACVGSTASATSPAGVSGLVQGTSYYACVQSQDDAGNTSAWVASASTALLDSGAPTPGGGGTISTSNIGTSSVDLSWTAASDSITAVGDLTYQVYYLASSNSTDFDTIAEVEAGSAFGSATAGLTSTTVTGLSLATDYQLNIVVADEAGNKALYSTASITTLNDTTDPVPGNSGTIAVSVVGSTAVTLSWTKGTDNLTAQSSLSYRVYYSTSSSFDSEAEVKAGTDASGLIYDAQGGYISGLSIGTTYYFNVVISDQLGNDTVYSKVSATTDDTQQRFVKIDKQNSTTICGLTAKGEAYCWGFDFYEGDGTAKTSSNVPVRVAPGYLFKDISVGDKFTCGLQADGKVLCWGEGTNHRLGRGSTTDSTVPVAVTAVDDDRYRKIDSGQQSTCAMADSSQIYCWGWGNGGTLGDGGVANNTQPTPVTDGGELYIDLEMSKRNTCAVTADSKGQCWGLGTNGGNGDGATSDNTTPNEIANSHKWLTVVPGSYRTGCGITTSGDSYCWGDGRYYGLGNGLTSNSSVPVAISSSAKFVSMHTTVNGACAIGGDGVRTCWGYNTDFELDTEVSGNITLPTSAASGDDPHRFVSFVSHYFHGMGLTSTGEARSFGEVSYGLNEFFGLGNLSNGTVTDTEILQTNISTGRAIKSLSSGGNFTTALNDRGAVVSWGGGANGQLGDGQTSDQALLVGLTSDKIFTQVVAGYRHACGLTDGGLVFCWGRNDQGQLGDGTTTDSSSPVQINSASQFRSIAVGGEHSCAIAEDGAAYCWGDDNYGQLGDDASLADQLSPVLVGGGYLYRKLSLGMHHSCAMVDDGRAYCWGRNHLGQLGDATTTDRTGPVSGASTLITDISAGDNHTCIIDAAATGISCTGDNGSGQAGQSSGTSDVSSFTSASGLYYIQVIAGGQHTCGLTFAGSVYCFGDDSSGQLGDDASLTNQYSPVAVSGSDLFIQIGAGGLHSCGLLVDGTVKCWGEDSAGQLGDSSSFTQQPTPVSVDLDRL